MVAMRIRVTRDGRKCLRLATTSYQLTAAIVVPSISPLSKRYFWNESAAWINIVKNSAASTEIKAACVVAPAVLSLPGDAEPGATRRARGRASKVAF